MSENCPDFAPFEDPFGKVPVVIAKHLSVNLGKESRTHQKFAVVNTQKLAVVRSARPFHISTWSESKLILGWYAMCFSAALQLISPAFV